MRAALVSLLCLTGLACSKRDPGPKATAAYVDSTLCADCHAAIAKSYRESGMGRSFAPASAEAISTGEFRHGASGKTYALASRDGRLILRRTDTAGLFSALEMEVHWVMGSGNHSRSLLSRTSDGRLLHLPISWYSDGRKWAMSPGFDRPDHSEFRRAITFDCLFCHAAYPKLDHDPKPSDDATFPAALPGSIDCQRCHGPGSIHVKKATAESIVNPKKLGRWRGMEVCFQCHLETSSRPLPYSIVRFDRGLFSYRPGEPLSGYAVHFDHAPGTGHEDKFEIAGAAYRLMKSACFTRSEMDCTTCHDPHKRTGNVNKTCQGCHTGAHRGAASHSGCTSCHMPKRRTDDVVHVVMTDHWIRRNPPKTIQPPPQEKVETVATAYRGDVVPYYPRQLDDELYLALAQVVEGANRPAGIPRLRAAIQRQQPSGALYYYHLADAQAQSGESEDAYAMYEEALRRDGRLLRAIRNYGAALLEGGRPERAVEVLRKAPEDAASLANLGRALAMTSQLADAEQAYRKALALQPDLADARRGLGKVLLDGGRLEEAESTLKEALRWEPRNADALYNLGTALGQMGKAAEAERFLLAAIQLEPKRADSYNNLGLVALSRNDAAAASKWFQKALEADPGHQAARTNLQRLLGR